MQVSEQMTVGLGASERLVGSAAVRLPHPSTIAIGYNHQIGHGGRHYHVQTEDSGRERCHITSHVFHAGLIIASNRVSYECGANGATVIDLLKKTHKSMLRRLVDGSLDGAIEGALGAPLVVPRKHGPRRAKGDEPSSPLPVGVVDEGRGDEGDESGRLAFHAGVLESLDMDNVKQVLESLVENVTGTLGVALVDYESGMCLGTAGSGIDIDIAAAGNMEVMKAKTKVMRDLGIHGGIEDMLISLESQYHIIRPVGDAMFLYIAFDRKLGNLAMARHKLAAAAGELRL